MGLDIIEKIFYLSRRVQFNDFAMCFCVDDGLLDKRVYFAFEVEDVFVEVVRG